MLGIFREEIFSPNRVSDDAAILRLTAESIRRQGYPVQMLSPEELTPETPPDIAFGMCEGPACLRILRQWETMGYLVVNSPWAVRNTHRHRMLALLHRTPIPFPKTMIIQTTETVNGHFDIKKGVWVKRGDVHSTHPQDVQLHFDRYSIEKALRELHARWIEQAVLQQHMRGDLIKFYGVLPRKWFHYFYQKPDEVQGYPFSPEQIQKTAELAASRLGLDVYGGDFVITENGHYLIDVNSWPSFAICREEAAEQIASCLIHRYQNWVPRYSFQWRSA
jgi:hypothetical protein